MMAVTVSYPGVYVEEDASSTISISAQPTAVPIIPVYGKGGGAAYKINNYLELVKSMGGEDAVIKDAANVRAYFECGGGPCYIAEHSYVLNLVPRYDDITLIVQAGDTTITTASLVDLCAPGSGRFAILDGPTTEITDASAADVFDAVSFAAVYYPSLLTGWEHTIDPSAVAAGIYCATDRKRGVWKAPANVSLPAGYTPVFKVTDDLQGQYNSGKAINMIRTFDNLGTVIWGARTLDDSDDWRYVSVRRLFNSVERDIGTAMQPMVFELNNQPTWEKVRSAITNYLYSLWKSGALVGGTEKEAYFIEIGEGITMTSDDIAQGKMIVKVGMSAVRPAEFIVLQFTQDVGQL
jgi:uncharacterized protein